jgi:ribonuclease HI
LAVIARPLGVRTNNVAEYAAVVLALRKAHKLGATDIDLRLDSKLLVEQLNGRWRIRHAGLIGLHREAQQLLAGFRSYRITHEPREMNRAADALANLALDDPDRAAALERAVAARSGLPAPDAEAGVP